MIDGAEAHGPGRPRNACAEGKILDATLGLLSEVGFAGLTVDGVAARAGVGRATIYRRWPSKGALVLAASKCLIGDVPEPDTGTVRGDLIALLSGLVEHLRGTRMGCLLPALAAEARGNAELAEIVTEFADDRRTHVRFVLRRARERGELRPGTDLDVLIDVLAGPAFYRMMISGGPPTAARMVKVVDMVLDGVAADSREP